MVFQTKCVFKEVMDVDAMIVGRYEAFTSNNPVNKVPLNIKVESPLGEVVYEMKDSAANEFTIEHPMEGEYRLCFTSKSTSLQKKNVFTALFLNYRITIISISWPLTLSNFTPFVSLSYILLYSLFSTGYQIAQTTRILLKWREGVEATNFESLAKKDNLDSVHTELLRLEDSIHNIHLELQNIRRKEEQMRDVNGKKEEMF